MCFLSYLEEQLPFVFMENGRHNAFNNLMSFVYSICPWKSITKKSDIKIFMLSFMWSFCKRSSLSFLFICCLLSVYCADVSKKTQENQASCNQKKVINSLFRLQLWKQLWNRVTIEGQQPKSSVRGLHAPVSLVNIF